jgi:ABC-type glutathione transport system ATPase component
VQPRLIVCDEPTSALDVSVQAQILNLLRQLQRDLGLSLVFITHNIGVVEYLADDIVVMQRGRVEEKGLTIEVLSRPESAYTRTLLDAVPRMAGGRGLAAPGAVAASFRSDGGMSQGSESEAAQRPGPGMQLEASGQVLQAELLYVKELERFPGRRRRLGPAGAHGDAAAATRPAPCRCCRMLRGCTRQHPPGHRPGHRARQ